MALFFMYDSGLFFVVVIVGWLIDGLVGWFWFLVSLVGQRTTHKTQDARRKTQHTTNATKRSAHHIKHVIQHSTAQPNDFNTRPTHNPTQRTTQHNTTQRTTQHNTAQHNTTHNPTQHKNFLFFVFCLLEQVGRAADAERRPRGLNHGSGGQQLRPHDVPLPRRLPLPRRIGRH